MTRIEELIFNRITELKKYVALYEDKPLAEKNLRLNLLIYFYLQRGVRPTPEQFNTLLKAF